MRASGHQKRTVSGGQPAGDSVGNGADTTQRGFTVATGDAAPNYGHRDGLSGVETLHQGLNGTERALGGMKKKSESAVAVL